MDFYLKDRFRAVSELSCSWIRIQRWRHGSQDPIETNVDPATTEEKSDELLDRQKCYFYLQRSRFYADICI